MKTEEVLSGCGRRHFRRGVSGVVVAGVAQRSHRDAPVLVFVYEPSQGWLARNVGNGPALNVM